MNLDLFDAYYLVSEFTTDGRPYLFGTARGHFVRVHPDVCLIRMAKDELPNDTKGTIRCDYTLDAADPESISFAYALFQDINADRSGLHPVAAALVEEDIADGLNAEQIIELRGGIICAEFLGFTEEHVKMVRPQYFEAREIEVDGVVITTTDWIGGRLL